MYKYIIIGTTSVNRPELHSDVIPEWIEWINKLDDKEYKIVWFINIDIIEKLEKTYDGTMNNFCSINKDRFEIHFSKNKDSKGNFLEACRGVSFNIKNYIDDLRLSEKSLENIKIIWLEDDWKLNIQKGININELLDKYSSPYSHINLSFIRNNYIWALAPSIISYNLWIDLFYEAWKNQKISIDPEHCVGLYYHKHYGNPNNLINLTVVNKSTNIENHRCVQYDNGYYTYHDMDFCESELSYKYIKKEEIRKKFNRDIIFIRITPSFCCDYGRDFLKKNDLKKIK